MLPYTVYSEAGGVGKTTLSAALAHAHARLGRNVLVIDMDPQLGSLTYLLGVDVEREAETNNLVRHLIGRPLGDFDDLIHETSAGFDLIPNHNEFELLSDWLDRAEENGLIENPVDVLRQTLIDHDIPDRYDTIIVDPPATAGIHLSVGLAATRSLVVPVEPTAKGTQSIDGLSAMVDNLEDILTDAFEQEMSIGVLGVVPNGVGRTTNQDEYLQRIRDLGYPAPVALRQRHAMFEGCWDKQCTPFEFVEEHRSRTRDHEMETLAKIDELAEHLERRATT